MLWLAEGGAKALGRRCPFEVNAGLPGEEIAQVGAGLDAVRFVGSDQIGEMRPVAATLSG